MQIALATLNCAGRQQPVEKISQIVAEATTRDTHLFALAVQEVAPVMEALLDSSSSYTAPIYRGIEAGLRDSGLVLIGQSWTGGIGLLIYARAAHAHVETAAVSFGQYWTSLKGAVGCRVTVADNSTLTFVATHLPAHQGKQYVEQRNLAFKILARGLVFGDSGIYDTNNLFIFGDLNYRAFTGREEESLLHFDFNAGDELTIERQKGNVLRGMAEAPVTFKPTFKYYFDSQELNHKRSASWTDRILYSDQAAQVLAYSSIQNYTASDHRPVYLRVVVNPAARVAPQSLPEVYVLPGQLTGAASKTLGTGLFLATTKIGWFLVAMLLVGCYVVL